MLVPELNLVSHMLSLQEPPCSIDPPLKNGPFCHDLLLECVNVLLMFFVKRSP
jgi:hypothetical protein